MSNDEIDLERGDPARAEATEKKAATRSRATKGGSAPKPVAAETSLKARLENVFEKLAKQMEARGDEELATALSEEKSNMSQGLVSLTKNLTPLRGPLVVVVSLVEPVLAFGRVGGILVRRAVARRARKVAEWEAAQQQQPEESTPYTPVT